MMTRSSPPKPEKAREDGCDDRNFGDCNLYVVVAMLYITVAAWRLGDGYRFQAVVWIVGACMWLFGAVFIGVHE